MDYIQTRWRANDKANIFRKLGNLPKPLFIKKLLVFIAAIGICGIFHAEVTSIDLLAPQMTWQKSYGLESVITRHGVMSVTTNAEHGHTLPVKVDYVADELPYIHMQIQSGKSQKGMGRIFFTTDQSPNMSDNKAVSLSYNLKAGEPQIITFSMAKNSHYNGRITGLRLDFHDSPGSSFEIGQLFVSDSPSLKEVKEVPHSTSYEVMPINLLDSQMTWQKSYGLESVIIRDGIMSVTTNAKHGHTLPIKVDYVATELPYIQMRIQSEKDQKGLVRIFFTTDQSPKMSDNKAVSVPYDLKAGELQIITFSMIKNSHYNGKITGLRLDFHDFPGSSYKIEQLFVSTDYSFKEIKEISHSASFKVEAINLLDPQITWQKSYGIESVITRDGIMSVTTNAKHGHTLPIKVDYLATELSYIQMQIQSEKDQKGIVKIFFTTDQSPKMSDNKAVSLSYDLKAEKPQIITFSMSQNSYYNGRITGLRLDFHDFPGSSFKIGQFFVSGSPSHKEIKTIPKVTLFQEKAMFQSEITVKPIDEATGHIAIYDDSIEMEKTNARGQLVVQVPMKFTVQKGQSYWIECEYTTSNSGANDILLLRGNLTKDEPVSKNLTPGVFSDKWLWATYSSVRNMPNGRYDKRYGTFTASTDSKEVIVNLLMWGNPFTVTVRDIKIHPTPWPEVPAYQQEKYQANYTVDEVMEILKKRPESTAKLSRLNGHKTITINGMQDGFPLYKGLGIHHGINRGQDYANFGKIGIQKQIVSVNTGKISPDAEDGFWSGIGKYDFKQLDKRIYETLQKNPYANIVMEFYIRSCPFWQQHRPVEELAVNYKGERVYGPGLYGTFTKDFSIVDKPGSGKYWLPSWSSEIFRQDCAEMIRAATEHISKQPYGKVVIGATFAGGDDGQFGSAFYDQSKSTHRYFHQKLQEKYVSIDKLNQIWKSSYRSFDEIPLPEKRVEDWAVSNRPINLETDFNDLARHCSVYEFRDAMAKAFKESIKKDAFVVAYGYPSGMYFANLKYLDGLCFQPGYFQRRPGFPSINFPRSLKHRDDLMYITEFDTRGLPDPVFNRFYAEGTGRTENQSEWNQAHRKLVGNILSNEYLYWYYDMNQYYNSPAYRQEIKVVQTVIDHLFSKPKTKFRPDVCAVMSDRELQFTNHWMMLTQHINYNPQYQEYAISGVPMDKLYLSEIRANPSLQDYKVLIFFQNAYFSDEDRDFINKELKKDGRTLIWVYNSGFISDRGMSDNELSELVGIRIRHDQKPSKPLALYKKDAPFTDGVPEMCGGLNYLGTIFSAWPGWETFRVDDDSAIPMAVFAGNNHVAGAMKKFKDWTSIYLANPHSLHGKLLQNIARDAGCYVAGDYGQELSIDGDFASVHGIRQVTDYSLVLPPGKSKIYEAFSNTLLGEDISSYTFPVEPWQTYWFLFK